MSSYYWRIIFISLAVYIKPSFNDDTDLFPYRNYDSQRKVPKNDAILTCQIITIRDHVPIDSATSESQSDSAESCLNLCYDTKLCFGVSFIQKRKRCYFHDESEPQNLPLYKKKDVGASFNYFNCTKKYNEANILKTLNNLMQKASIIDVPKVTTKHPMKVNTTENIFSNGVMVVGHSDNVERCLDLCYEMPACFRVSYIGALSRCHFHNETMVTSTKTFSQLDVNQYLFVERNETISESWSWVPDSLKHQIKDVPLINVPEKGWNNNCQYHTTADSIPFYSVTYKGFSNSSQDCINVCYETELCFGVSFVEQLNLCFFHNNSDQNNVDLINNENITITHYRLDCIKKTDEVSGLSVLNQLLQTTHTISIPKVIERPHTRVHKIKNMLLKQGIIGSGHSNYVDSCLNVCYKMPDCFGVSFAPVVATCFFNSAETSVIDTYLDETWFHLLDVTFYFFVGYNEKTAALRNKYNKQLKKRIPQIAMYTVEAPLVNVSISKPSNECKPLISEYFSRLTVLAMGQAQSPDDCLSLCYNTEECFAFTVIHASDTCIFYSDLVKEDISELYRIEMDRTHYDLRGCESKRQMHLLRQYIENFNELKKIIPASQFSDAENITEICLPDKTMGVYLKNAHARIDQVSDEQHCLRICYHEAQCFSFTYHHMLKICNETNYSPFDVDDFIFDNTTYSTIKHCPGKDHTYKYMNFVKYFPKLAITLPTPNISAADNVSKICRINQTAGVYAENVYARFDKVSNAEHCASICYNDEQCFGFTYQSVLEICVLHDHISDYFTLEQTDSNEVSFFNMGECLKKKYNWHYFMNASKMLEKNISSDLQQDSLDAENVSKICDVFESVGYYYDKNAHARYNQVSNKQHCLSICYNDEQCLSFTYQSMFNICILHNKTAYINYKLQNHISSDVSYSRIQGCHKKYSCEYIIDSVQQCGVPSERFLPNIGEFSMRNNRHRIIGGSEAAPHSYPWTAFLVNGNISTCGGVLISNDTVVTAAHCLLGTENDTVKDNFFVYLGMHEWKVIGQCQSIHKVAQVIKHPQYEQRSKFNDIGLIKLANPVKFFSDYIRPACLPANNESTPSNKQSCIVVGWGRTELNCGNTSRWAYKLQQLIQPLWNDSQCRNERIMLDGKFCASTGHKLRSPFKGDSGGPYMCYENGQYVIYGLVNSGSLCYNNNTSTVYAKLSAYLDWIEETRKQW